VFHFDQTDIMGAVLQNLLTPCTPDFSDVDQVIFPLCSLPSKISLRMPRVFGERTFTGSTHIAVKTMASVISVTFHHANA